jgi:hypothetical protein
MDDTMFPIGAAALFSLLTIIMLLFELIESSSGDVAVGGAHMAIYNILQTCNFAFQVSFAIPIAIKLFSICPNAQRALKKGSFYLGDEASLAIGWIAFLWLVITAILLILPAKFPVTGESIMVNYCRSPHILSLSSFILTCSYGLYLSLSQHKI